MQRLDRQQLANLVLLTLVWGLNWPVMKMGVSDYPALTFRALSIMLGVPVMAAALLAMKVPFRVPRRYWPELLVLAATNMVIWQVCIILAIQNLSSGRSAILGYTMPIFSAVIGALLFKATLGRRAWLGVLAAALGVSLLLWHELTGLAGRPAGVVLALVAASTWALGTQLLRRTRIELPTLTITFWMTAVTGIVVTVLASAAVNWAIAYNAVMVFGYAHAAWFFLARGLPPVASTISVLFIPVLGVFSGALWLGEAVHWQDFASMVLMVAAIASVLWPSRVPAAAEGVARTS
jgi:drug/metabolite transporter (DMT)-like permease